VFFSNIDDVPELMAPRDPINWDYIQYHLSAGVARGSQTGLKAVAELLPGRQMRYSGGHGKESSAWPIADIIDCPFESPAAAEAGLRAAAAAAVGGWARRYDRIALELSGGFDSAVVLGLIREQAPDTRVLAINYLIAHPEGDERTYALAAADHNRSPLRVEPLSAEGQRFDFKEVRHWLRPKNSALSIGGSEARQRAASTICAEAVFSGTGGDQVFGQDLTPSVLAEAVKDRRALREVLIIAHDYAKMSANTFWNVGWTTIKDVCGPKRALKTLLQTPNAYLTRHGVEGANFESFAHPDVLDVLERVSYAKFRQVISIYGLNDCYARYSSECKPDEVNPLQSQLVFEASLRIPSYWMNPAGRRRGLARRAFGDLLPDTILSRRGKGSTTSHTLQVLANNTKFLRELMLDGHLVRRGLLDKERLEIDLSPQRLSAKLNFSGLVKSIATELWVKSYASHFTSLAPDNRLEILAVPDNY